MDQWRIGIVAFGFGEPSSANPNASIGALARRLALRSDGTPIFTDRDVSAHLSDTEVVVEEIDPTRMPTTWRLALMAIQRAEKYKLGTLKVVAAPCLMWRCLRDLRWAATECGVTVTLAPRPTKGYQYDPAAQTFYTRAAWKWWPFEIAYRAASSIFPKWYKRTRA